MRSLCTTVCKWTYLGHEERWDPTFFDAIDLHELTTDDFERIGYGCGRRASVWGP